MRPWANRIQSGPGNMKPVYVGLSVVLFTLCCLTALAQESPLVQFFADTRCSRPIGNPVGPDTIVNCVEGIATSLGVRAVSFPSCQSGRAVLQISDTPSCGRPTFSPPVTTDRTGTCLSLFTGAEIASAGFVCVGGDTASRSSSPSSTLQLLASPSKATIPTSGGSTPTPVLESSPSSSDRIALGVGIGIGLPIFMAVVTLAWCYGRHARSRRTHSTYAHAIGLGPTSSRSSASESPPAYQEYPATHFSHR